VSIPETLCQDLAAQILPCLPGSEVPVDEDSGKEWGEVHRVANMNYFCGARLEGSSFRRG